MNTLTIILAMLAIIVTMGGIIYVLVKRSKEQKKEILKKTYPEYLNVLNNM